MSGARRIAVVTTSRADYGIYRPLLRTLATDPTVSLLILASGSHLMRDHGYTLDAIDTTAEIGRAHV